MVAVTAFNSLRLRAYLKRRHGDAGMAAMDLVLNGVNLIGGIALFINAKMRHEIVWVVLEVFFVTIAVKGIWQGWAALRPPRCAACHHVLQNHHQVVWDEHGVARHLSDTQCGG
jgi:hypothetical protein